MYELCSHTHITHTPHIHTHHTYTHTHTHTHNTHTTHSQETKSQLMVTLKKLKEAREEGEQIRADLKTMIIQYQVSSAEDMCIVHWASPTLVHSGALCVCQVLSP